MIVGITNVQLPSLAVTTRGKSIIGCRRSDGAEHTPHLLIVFCRIRSNSTPTFYGIRIWDTTADKYMILNALNTPIVPHRLQNSLYGLPSVECIERIHSAI